MILRLVFLASFIVSASPLRADELYTFNVTPASGALDAFNFSFVVPTILQNGNAPSFTPFVVTDGGFSADIVQSFDYVIGGADTHPNNCLEFLSQSAIPQSCGVQIPPSAKPQAAIIFLFNETSLNPTGLPTQIGEYSDISWLGIFTSPTGLPAQFPTGTAVLTITNVPEPSTGMLPLTAIVLVAAFHKRKRPSVPIRNH